MKITDEQVEQIGLMVDKLENGLFALKMPLPDKMHLECFSALVREARDSLAEIVRDVSGNDPWEFNSLAA